MIKLSEVERIHQILIDQFGGTTGVRDIEALKSALDRPFQTFDEKELYPTVLEKAASLLESILNNHPFVDGNKRTGYTVARIFLLQNGNDITATEQEKYDFIVGIASGDIKFEEILYWLKIHTSSSSGA